MSTHVENKLVITRQIVAVSSQKNVIFIRVAIALVQQVLAGNLVPRIGGRCIEAIDQFAQGSGARAAATWASRSASVVSGGNASFARPSTQESM